MKPFLAWLALTFSLFAALGGGYHGYLEASPRRVLVVVDASHPMTPALGRVSRMLAAIAERPYTEFSLFTEKSQVHGWSQRFRPGKISAYAPRELDRLEQLRKQPEFSEADEVLFITNAAQAELGAFDDWRILRP